MSGHKSKCARNITFIIFIQLNLISILCHNSIIQQKLNLVQFCVILDTSGFPTVAPGTLLCSPQVLTGHEVGAIHLLPGCLFSTQAFITSTGNAFGSFSLIEVQFIYSIILVPGIKHSDSVFYRLHSIKSCYKIKAITSYAIQYILVDYLFYTQQFASVSPISLIHPSPLPTHHWLPLVCFLYL